MLTSRIIPALACALVLTSVAAPCAGQNNHLTVSDVLRGQQDAEHELGSLASQLVTPATSAWKDVVELNTAVNHVWAQLAVFKLRFEVNPRELAGWQSFAARARQLSGLTDPRDVNGDLPPRQQTSPYLLALTARLRDWGGDTDDAIALAMPLSEEKWNYEGCYQCILENGVRHDWFRADLELRQGNMQRALALGHRVMIDSAYCGMYFEEHAALAVWYAGLLYKAGCVDQAQAIWGAVANQCPDDFTGQAAVATLQRLGEPSGGDTTEHMHGAESGEQWGIMVVGECSPVQTPESPSANQRLLFVQTPKRKIPIAIAQSMAPARGFACVRSLGVIGCDDKGFTSLALAWQNGARGSPDDRTVPVRLDWRGSKRGLR